VDKLEKNVKQVVAEKVLKDIHKIVREEEVKEKNEKRWAKLIVGMTLLTVIVLVVLKSV